MNTKQLRQKILDLAIRGKLVPQDPNDEPASVLLERIKAEKEQLIKEGKIKRGKKSSTTSDKPHYPFDLPDGWCWLQLDEVADIARGGSPRPISQFITDDPYGVNWIKIGDTEKDGKYINTCAQKIIKEGVKRSRVVKKGDFLLTNSMSFGRPYILNVDGCIHDGWLVISPIGKPFEINFLYYLLSSSFAYSQFSEKAGGAVVSNLNIEKVAHSLFPLPPLDEQKRIVVEIERILDAIEIVNDSTHELSLAISNVKAKVLELAISGRLVPQDPADEPAEVLLKRVNPNAVVSADTSHYQHLPQGWCVCKLEDIVDYEQPQRYIVESTDYNDTYKTPVLTAGKSFIIGYTNETAGIFNNLPVIIFDDFTTDSKYVDFPFKVKSSAMKILHVKNGVNVKYVYYFMSITRLVGKTHKRYWISEYSKLNIPLPPYNEQCRIVEAIENINRRIDDIAEAL